MPKSSRYSDKVNQELEFRVLDILNHSETGLSIQQIQREDLILAHHTPQKLTRVLGKLIDMGFIRKSKSKSTGHMVYKSVSVMLAQGYTVEDVGMEIKADINFPENINWELEAEKRL